MTPMDACQVWRLLALMVTLGLSNGLADVSDVNTNSFSEPKDESETGNEEDVQTQKCVAGYCLPMDYQKLELPITTRATNVGIETEIMDFLTVR